MGSVMLHYTEQLNRLGLYQLKNCNAFN